MAPSVTNKVFDLRKLVEANRTDEALNLAQEIGFFCCRDVDVQLIASVFLDSVSREAECWKKLRTEEGHEEEIAATRQKLRDRAEEFISILEAILKAEAPEKAVKAFCGGLLESFEAFEAAARTGVFENLTLSGYSPPSKTSPTIQLPAEVNLLKRTYISAYPHALPAIQGKFFQVVYDDLNEIFTLLSQNLVFMIDKRKLTLQFVSRAPFKLMCVDKKRRAVLVLTQDTEGDNVYTLRRLEYSNKNVELFRIGQSREIGAMTVTELGTPVFTYPGGRNRYMKVLFCEERTKQKAIRRLGFRESSNALSSCGDLLAICLPKSKIIILVRITNERVLENLFITVTLAIPFFNQADPERFHWPSNIHFLSKDFIIALDEADNSLRVLNIDGFVHRWNISALISPKTTSVAFNPSGKLILIGAKNVQLCHLCGADPR